MDDLSPPGCPPINRDLGGPEPYQFEPLVQQCFLDCGGPWRKLSMVIAGFQAIEGSRAYIFTTKNAGIEFAFRHLLSGERRFGGSVTLVII